MFSTFGFCAKKILGIVGYQIELEKIFSLIGILISFKRCLQSKILDKLIFINKNWPNDLRIGCKSPSRLANFVETHQRRIRGVSKSF